jgi:hypothetical protein
MKIEMMMKETELLRKLQKQKRSNVYLRLLIYI